MPYPRQTLSQLRTQARSDAASATSSGVLLRFSNLGITADLVSGQTNGLYGYLDYIAKQSNPFTATDEWLEAWAALKGVFRKQAQAASFQVSFPGTVGEDLPAGTPVVRLIDGFEYTTVADATVGSGSQVVATVTATETGADGNTDSGAAMVLGASVSGVTSTGSAGTVVAVGVDQELDPSLRTRMLEAYAEPPQGGSLSDYLEWADAIPGVTRAWIAPNLMGPGTVVCFFMMDSAEAAHAGFPQGTNGVATNDGRDVIATGDQLVVANALFAKCNVNALVYGCAPTQNAVVFSISGLTNASAAVKAAIQDAIAAVFLANGSPGGVRLSDGTTGGTLEMSQINGAIESVSGSAGYVITAVSASAGAASPTTNIVSNTGALPVLGATDWL